MMSKDKVLIFDLFGVLLSRSLASSRTILSGLFKVSESELSDVYLRHENDFDLGLINNKEFWRKICFDLGKDIEPNTLTKIVIDSIKLDKDVLLLIHYLKDYFTLILCTNYRLEWFKLIDEKFNISILFNKVYISSQIQLIKPNKKIFDVICIDYSCTPTNCLLIDDTTLNIKSFVEWGGVGIKFNNIFETEFLLRQRFKEILPSYDEFYSGIILLTNDKKIILQRRDKKKSIDNPNKLSVFGGRSEGKETPIQCAVRELKEETTLDVKATSLIPIKELSYPLGDSKWMLCTYYLFEGVDVNSITLNEGQFIEIWNINEVVENKKLTNFPRLVIKEKLLPTTHYK